MELHRQQRWALDVRRKAKLAHFGAASSVSATLIEARDTCDIELMLPVRAALAATEAADLSAIVGRVTQLATLASTDARDGCNINATVAFQGTGTMALQEAADSSLIFGQVTVPAGGNYVPPASSVTNSQGVWTIRSSDNAILLNGSQAGTGRGTVIELLGDTIYVLGINGDWFRWNGDGTYTDVGPTDPGATPPAPPSNLPSPWTTGIPNVLWAEISLDWQQSDSAPDYNAHWITGNSSYVAGIASLAGGDPTKVIMRTPMGGDFPGCCSDRRNGMCFFWAG